MSDADLRELERKASGGDARARQALAEARARLGDYRDKHTLLKEALDEYMLPRAAGLAAARAALGRSSSRWRAISEVIVRFVVQHTRGWPKKEKRRAFIDAYPFGQRELWPYKMWLKVVREYTKPDVKWSRKTAAATDTQTRSMFGDPP